jgi:hypothetical protein
MPLDANGAPAQDDQEVRVQGVLRDPRSDQPVAFLADPTGQRGLPIWIGQVEAMALDSALQGVSHRRPLTHDLLATLLERLHARIARVRVTELREETFFARIHLQTPEGELEIDARPSDAMILAVRARCPISVERSLFLDRAIPRTPPPLGKLGVEFQELDEDLKAAFGYRGEGLLVTQVDPGGPAAEGGMRREDILIRLNERDTVRPQDVEEALAGAHEGVEALVFRRGKRLTLRLSWPGDAQARPRREGS